MKQGYFCTNCGYDEASDASWCALGCGRDYNKMIAVPERLIKKLKDKNYERGYWAYRDELKQVLGTRDREDSFFTKGEIKRQLRGLK